jgi:hypothetical protein
VPWPLTVALVVVGAVLLLLALPVHFTLIGQGSAGHRLRVRALLGLVDRELTAASAPAQDKPEPSPSRPPGGGTRRFRALLQSRGFLRRLRRYLGRLYRALHVGKLHGTAHVGLDDPADTGELWALVGPASLVLTRRHPGFVLTPSFDQARLDLDGTWRVTLVPLELLAVTLAFAFSPATLRAVFAAVRAR